MQPWSGGRAAVGAPPRDASTVLGAWGAWRLFLPSSQKQLALRGRGRLSNAVAWVSTAFPNRALSLPPRQRHVPSSGDNGALQAPERALKAIAPGIPRVQSKLSPVRARPGISETWARRHTARLCRGLRVFLGYL